MDQSDYFQYSRPTTPSTNRRQFQTSSPKPVVVPLPTKTVSLAEWEANTPLNQTELASLAIVKEACDTRPLPAQVCVIPRGRCPSNLDPYYLWNRYSCWKQPKQDLAHLGSQERHYLGKGLRLSCNSRGEDQDQDPHWVHVPDRLLHLHQLTTYMINLQPSQRPSNSTSTFPT